MTGLVTNVVRVVVTAEVVTPPPPRAPSRPLTTAGTVVGVPALNVTQLSPLHEVDGETVEAVPVRVLLPLPVVVVVVVTLGLGLGLVFGGGDDGSIGIVTVLVSRMVMVVSRRVTLPRLVDVPGGDVDGVDTWGAVVAGLFTTGFNRGTLGRLTETHSRPEHDVVVTGPVRLLAPVGPVVVGRTLVSGLRIPFTREETGSGVDTLLVALVVSSLRNPFRGAPNREMLRLTHERSLHPYGREAELDPPSPLVTPVGSDTGPGVTVGVGLRVEGLPN